MLNTDSSYNTSSSINVDKMDYLISVFEKDSTENQSFIDKRTFYGNFEDTINYAKDLMHRLSNNPSHAIVLNQQNNEEHKVNEDGSYEFVNSKKTVSGYEVINLGGDRYDGGIFYEIKKDGDTIHEGVVEGEQMVEFGGKKYDGLRKLAEGLGAELKVIDSMASGGMMAKGGKVYVDLFANRDEMPYKVKIIVDKYDNEYGEDIPYQALLDMQKDVEKVGYTFDFGLDSSPYGLRPMGVEISQLEGYDGYGEDEMADGGMMAKGGEKGRIVMIPTYVVKEIKESVDMGYDTLVEGMIGRKRKGLMLINEDYEVRGTYDIGLKEGIEDLIKKIKSGNFKVDAVDKYADGGMMADGGKTDFDYELKVQPDFKYKNTANRWLEDNSKDSLMYKLAILLLREKKNPDEILGIKKENQYARLLRSLDKIKGESTHEMSWRNENYTLNEAEKWAKESLSDVFYVHASHDKMADGGMLKKGGRIWAEIKNDFEDDGEIYIDAWKTENDDEGGSVIAKVKVNGDVEYFDERAKTDVYAQEMIKEAKESRVYMAKGGIAGAKEYKIVPMIPYGVKGLITQDYKNTVRFKGTQDEAVAKAKEMASSNPEFVRVEVKKDLKTKTVTVGIVDGQNKEYKSGGYMADGGELIKPEKPIEKMTKLQLMRFVQKLNPTKHFYPKTTIGGRAQAKKLYDEYLKRKEGKMAGGGKTTVVEEFGSMNFRNQYDDWEMVVISQLPEKDGGEIKKDRYLVSARNINEAKEIATNLWLKEWGNSDFSIVKVMSDSLYRLKYMDMYADGGVLNRDLNIYVKREADKRGISKLRGKEYETAMAQAAVDALGDANFHKAAKKLVMDLEGESEWSDKLYGSVYYDSDENVRDFAVAVSQKAQWSGEDIANAFIYTLKMNGSHRLADKIKNAM